MNAERIVSAEAVESTEGRSAGRRIFFLDIENYAGKAVLEPRDVDAVRESIERQFRLGDNDLVVVGTSHANNFLCAALSWPGPRHLLKHGHDGADMALLSAIDEYHLDSFAGVYLMSGDGIFGDKASELVARGLDVTAVSRPDSLSWRLLEAVPCLAAA